MKKAIYSIPQTYSFAIVPILPIADFSGKGGGSSTDSSHPSLSNDKPARL